VSRRTRPQAENGASAVAEEHFCSNCGKPVHQGAHFCGFCGHGIPSLESQATLTDDAGDAGQATGATERLPVAVEQEIRAKASGAGPTVAPARRVLPAVPRRVAAAIGAVAVLVALIAAALLTLKPFDNSDDRARAKLRFAATNTLQVSRAAQNARTLDEIVAVGRQAQRAVLHLESSIGEVTAIDAAKLREPTAAALSAERDLLAAYARLATLHPDGLAAWQSIARDAADARLSLVQRGPAVERLGLGAAVLPAAAALERGQRALDGTVDTMQARLADWQERYRKAKRLRNIRVRRLERYGNQMRNHLTTYSALRSDLDNWLDRFGPQDVPFGRAEDFLSSALSQRQALLAAVSAMPLPAATVAASHRAVQALLDQSVRALDNAIDGARECTEDPFCFGDDFRHHPDWQEFMAASREINNSIGALTSSWEGALARAIHRVKERKLPRAPTV
jgi:hypothetical protein